MAKEPDEDRDEYQAVVRLAAGFLCRFALEHTDLLNDVDVVVPVPANPFRYARRGVSLPDELSRSIEEQLGLPSLLEALRSNAPEELELKGLSWQERRQAIRESIETGNLGLAGGSSVLLVDDIVTSGATLREAGRVLLAAGVQEIHAIALSHTEG